MNTPVNFELTKLLKEKGYKDKNILGTVRLSEPKYYDPNGIIHEIKDAFEEKDYKIEDSFNAPTIAEVVMWLYEKHGIWVSVQPNEPYIDNDWCFILYKDFKICYALEGYGSPMHAYESGIEYVLNNLISL